MLLIGIIITGMVVGAAAQFILGREGGQVDWTMAFVAGIAGSFIGGLIINLINGDGLKLGPSGLIGSLVGALIVTAIWQAVNARKAAGTKSVAPGRTKTQR
ncbi:MAG: GlsB/YeaQ/YmgE family stress response membrane protein [Candidatus Microthrix subdominans]|uniref:GlsB/YeaQ/YmgE family stress response membrane protein n=1 Tax=Candidatus Neomicrothrix subdominans TaxID=2954438 RepID=A0A936TE18_9ACTN|nr:GlsB/YeaQ/YmgE family stress response membrane protein [Candidatus Microthrix sp.]MBK9296622.1 GlsB/YeaQ/YmgE family stress response membrane protein [Candidatus Microthrix subdominans]MBK6968764.1 GlsB/YeaQ/YmgE family stress response membrane protein [Candidatus Microthrix sp.]MBK9558469.1 GlsB/YeaQ/YmgE family stress response membrane protein [Candidatus Microthrix sp.]MBP7594829.1 GlsB/YeaQ/YmgE family stress response membrane protein [Candidatus Microthrix sp.]MBP9066048.1 GlsB/YeaQ/Ym